jgi:FAD/FMN-containing dehydrogenase
MATAAYKRMRRSHRLDERPELFGRALKAIKEQLDPRHVLNPGILIDV